MYTFRQFLNVSTAVAIGTFVGVYAALHITNIALTVVTR